MFAIARCLLAAVVFWCVATTVARPQGNVVERQITAAPGQVKRFGAYINTRPDCTPGPLPAIRLVTPPAHGTVTIKRATFKATNFKQCLAIEVPALVAFYRAGVDFSGTDEFSLEVTSAGGRKEMQHFQVSASTSPGHAQQL